MLIKFYVIDEILPKVQIGKNFVTIWEHLRDLHENLDKDKSFFLKNMFFIMMDEHASLQEHFIKIKDI